MCPVSNLFSGPPSWQTEDLPYTTGTVPRVKPSCPGYVGRHRPISQRIPVSSSLSRLSLARASAS